MYGFWDMEGDWQNVSSFWADFCPLDPENQIFKKMKKTPWQIIRLHMLTTNDNHEVWFLRYGVQQTKMFCRLDRFLPIYPTHNPKNQSFEKMKEKKRGDIIIWCMVSEIWSMMDKIFCNIGHLLPFYPTMEQENQNFKKMKKITGDIIILHMCTINENHMMYGSWNMECDRKNVLSF